jgi:hypothetical protein
LHSVATRRGEITVKAPIAAALLGLASAFAHADTWTVTFHDMPDLYGQLDGQLTDIAVMFSGKDANLDGSIAADELQSLSFQLYGRNFLVFPIFQATTADGTPMTSSMGPFSYSISQRSFAQNTSVDGLVDDNFEDCLSFSWGTFTLENGAPMAWNTAGAPVTVEVVSDVSAVPEPAAWAMLLAGLTYLGRRSRGYGRTSAGR